MDEPFIDRLKYVLRVSRKPTDSEISESLKVVILGVFIMGIIGFLISIILSFISTK